MKKTLILIILDGFGLSEKTKGNAIKFAKTPNLDKIFSSFPFTRLQASGKSVGLPEGQMGNSEVGHMNIGAGRVIYQDLVKINNSIKNGSFFENPAFLSAIENSLKNNKPLHLMGLISDGGVHSHKDHLYNLLKLAKKFNLKRVYIHAILDGRDTLPKSGINFIKELQEKIKKIDIGQIATIMGRYYAMDRDNRWERIEKAYTAMTCKTEKTFLNPEEIIKKFQINK
jgi:2,3-bisphosphoglycerate-independent phosphoglycerate mutase